MSIFYSPTSKAFYSDAIQYPNLPKDLISVSDEQHMYLIEQINNHQKDIVVGSNNALTLIDRVVVPSWDDIRRKRNRLLTISDYTQMPDWSGDKQTWARYRQQLRDIPQNYTDTKAVVWPTPPGT
jgi:hypothetical protein